jgi:hypothetical protein
MEVCRCNAKAVRHHGVMSADSLVASLVLFAACSGGWHLAAGFRRSGRLYVRFAAVLLAALAVCTILGLGDVAALFLLPLAGAALGMAAWVRFGVSIPDVAAVPILAVALGLGLGGALSGWIVLSLLPVILAALVAMGAGLAAGALAMVLGACALGLAALAFAGQGAGIGMLLLVAAAVVGFARGRAAPAQTLERDHALILPVQQARAETMRSAISTGISTDRRKVVGIGPRTLRQ